MGRQSYIWLIGISGGWRGTRVAHSCSKRAEQRREHRPDVWKIAAIGQRLEIERRSRADIDVLIMDQNAFSACGMPAVRPFALGAVTSASCFSRDSNCKAVTCASPLRAEVYNDMPQYVYYPNAYFDDRCINVWFKTVIPYRTANWPADNIFLAVGNHPTDHTPLPPPRLIVGTTHLAFS